MSYAIERLRLEFDSEKIGRTAFGRCIQALGYAVLEEGREAGWFASTLDADFFFAHPYASWERGANENMNGPIRQFFSKKLRFDFITLRQIVFAMHRLNNRPRKCLGFKTPHEVFMKQLHSRHNAVALQLESATLFGIATRNGVMMISHIHHLIDHDEAKTLVEAVKRGAEERLIPILMTALAAGLALVPLALSAGQPGSEIQAPMAVVILFGLISSTVLNMVVVPALYLRFGAVRSELEAGDVVRRRSADL